MLSRICIPIALASNDIERLDEIVARGKPLNKGDHVYRQGDAFKSLFAVRSGSVKSIMLSRQGVEQITGFYFPGEVIGLDGLGRQQYATSTVALETASICEIPYHQLNDLSRELPSLQRHCMELMSNEIVDDHRLFTLLGKGDADNRLATFLLSISARNARRRLSTTHFRLPMTRADIGNHLGLTIETVSRVLQKFQAKKLIEVNNKEIALIDIEQLQKLSLVEMN